MLWIISNHRYNNRVRLTVRPWNTNVRWRVLNKLRKSTRWDVAVEWANWVECFWILKKIRYRRYIIVERYFYSRWPHALYIRYTIHGRKKKMIYNGCGVDGNTHHYICCIQNVYDSCSNYVCEFTTGSFYFWPKETLHRFFVARKVFTEK